MHPPENDRGRPGESGPSSDVDDVSNNPTPIGCPCGCAPGERCVTGTTPLQRYLERLARERSWDEHYVDRLRRRWRGAA